MSVLRLKDRITGQFVPVVAIKGETGDAAGFGTVEASVDANYGTPSVEVTASGEDTAKNFSFAFHNLKQAPYNDSDLRNQIATERARIDSFTHLAEGSTTGDAELIDGRTVDGVTYTNIGDAIRAVDSNLKSDLSDAVYNLAMMNNLDGENLQFVRYKNNGSFSKIVIEDYNENGLGNGIGYVTGSSNLFGGLMLAERIKSLAPDATLDTTNKTISFHSSWVNQKAYTTFPFKENTQYTLVIYGRNNENVQEANIAFAYTDGTDSFDNVKFRSNGTDSYAVYTSAEGKSIDYIKGLWLNGSVTYYYDKCGVFEGVVDETKFEDYVGESFPINWGDATSTVYGGSIDITNGLITATKNADGSAINSPVTYRISPVKVKTLNGQNNMLYYGNAHISYIDSFYNPDDFYGTDSQKLQQCFDALSNVGGNILINRKYTLTENLIINNDSDKKHFIHVIGIGINAGLDCGQYEITASKTALHSRGGVLWNNISFFGASACFDAGVLIRMFFTQCSFKGFDVVFKADGSEWQTGETGRYFQSLYLNQCTIKAIGTGFYISGMGAYDLNICDCLIEDATYAVRAVGGALNGVRISNNVVEGISTAGIFLNCDCTSAIISNNYFEGVPQTIYISANKTNRNLSIFNNYFVTNYEPAIIIEPNTILKQNMTAVIENNVSLVISNPEMNNLVETSNLFGGLYLANKIKAVASSSVIDITNKTVFFPAHEARDAVFTDFQFKENTRYTVILYGKNPYGIETNVTIRYTDGTDSFTNIKFALNGEDSYAIYVSDEGKTISNIGGLWALGETLLYYDRCGVFEGVIGESDFEPYAKPMVAFTTTPSVAQALSLKNNFASVLIGNDGGLVVSNYIEASSIDDLTVSGEYAYDGGIVIVNSSTSGILQRLYTAESSQWRFKPINGSWGNWNI